MLMIFCHTHHVQNYFVTNNNILGLIKVHSTLNIERLKGECVTDRMQTNSHQESI